MGLDKWAWNLQKKVWDEWKEKYKHHEEGFKVFYAPIKENPDLMIISFNPSGDAKNFEKDRLRFVKDDFKVQDYNSFISGERHLAAKMRDLFAVNLGVLRESVIFPICFFRSRDEETLKASYEKDYGKIKKFCLKLLKEEIFVNIKPKVILITSMHAYKWFKVAKEIKEEHCCPRIDRKRKENAICKALWGKTRIIAIPHPTGKSKPNVEQWKIIKEKVISELKKQQVL